MAAIFFSQKRADVENERRLGGVLEMDAVVIENALWMPRLAGHVGLGQLGPKTGCLDELRRRDVIGMGIDPVRSKQPLGPRLPNDDRQLARGLRASALSCDWASPDSAANRDPESWSLPPSQPLVFPAIQTASARRWSDRARRLSPLRSLNFKIAPAAPSSASSGWGAMTRISSMKCPLSVVVVSYRSRRSVKCLAYASGSCLAIIRTGTPFAALLREHPALYSTHGYRTGDH